MHWEKMNLGEFSNLTYSPEKYRKTNKSENLTMFTHCTQSVNNAPKITSHDYSQPSFSNFIIKLK